MGIEVFYRDTDGTLVGPVTQVGDERLRSLAFEASENAEEGSTASSRIPLDDINGDLIVPGLRLIGAKENTISNSSNTFIFAGYTADRNISRGGPDRFRTGASRLWDVGVVDPNTILEDRVMVGSDCNRPAETDVERITWLLSTTEGALIQDSRYFSSSNPESMDAVDYRGQTFKAIIDDCAQQSGKNYFITYFGDTRTTNLPWGTFSLFYDFTNSTAYSSTLRLSNDLADVDNINTFGFSQENTLLTRDPSRVYSGMLVPYDGGTAYVQRAATVNGFKRRDGTSPAQNVKTATKANRRGNRMLTDVSTEEDVITTEFQVPAAQVNDLRPGMRVRFRATHLPGYETPIWLRVLNRTVTQDSEATYKLRVEMSSTGVAADNVGETIGGYLCTAQGYQVPLAVSGLNQPMRVTLNGALGAGTGDSLADFGEYCVLYGGAVYSVRTYDTSFIGAQPLTPVWSNINDSTVYHGELGSTDCNFVPSHTLYCPPLTERTDLITWGTPTGVPSDAIARLSFLPWSGHNPQGSSWKVVISYVSGPDPRFENLQGCPFP